jgi:hypothetical protein
MPRFTSGVVEEPTKIDLQTYGIRADGSIASDRRLHHLLW